MRKLEHFAFDTGDVVFRGHENSKWRLETTLNRLARDHLARSLPPRHTLPRVDGMLHSFAANLATLGQLPEAMRSRRGRLEYARHYGLASPLLDFTYSPYVGLFFAYNGIKHKNGDEEKFLVVYALNIRELALAVAKLGTYDYKKFEEFSAEDANFFANGYPTGRLKFFRNAAS